MKCSFCGGTVPQNRGKMFVRLDGKVLYFCNSKCQKNQRMGRKGKATKWTATSRSLRGKQGEKGT